jgi:hypothetical protein
MLISFYGTSQNQATFDDIYFKPSDAKKMQKIQNNNETPNEKNGAKEIIYIDRNNDNSKVVDNSQVAPGDTAKVLAEANDSTENNQQQGHYLNGFNGNESDLEYAARIRRFHNPKYEIFIGDPRYNDIYFLDNSDWNVYVDGSYAYVTPTWTNPYWWDYNYNPYSWNSPFGFYNNWYNSPWGWDAGFGYGYGGFGYPFYGYGYGGYGYGGYGYGYGYGGYGGYPYYGGGLYSYKQHNPNHDEAVRREVSNLRPRLVGSSGSSSVINSGFSAGSSRNPYTVITGGSGSRQQNITAYNGYGSRVVRNTVNSSGSTFNRSSGIGIVRSGGIRTNNLERTYRTTINTQPRISASPQVYTNSNRSNYSNYSRPATNNVYRSPSPSNNSYSRPSPTTYSSPAPERSSSSFNSSSSSGSFRSSSSSFSGGGGGGGATRSSSSSSGGRR